MSVIMHHGLPFVPSGRGVGTKNRQSGGRKAASGVVPRFVPILERVVPMTDCVIGAFLFLWHAEHTDWKERKSHETHGFDRRYAS